MRVGVRRLHFLCTLVYGLPAPADDIVILPQASQARFVGLARCIERTRANKAKLLSVLQHPELPLHNNDSKLAARRRVVKRRVSHGPKTAAGVEAWDTFHTLAATAAKLGVSFAGYMTDRVLGTKEVPGSLTKTPSGRDGSTSDALGVRHNPAAPAY